LFYLLRVKFTVILKATTVCEIFARERRMLLIYGGVKIKISGALVAEPNKIFRQKEMLHSFAANSFTDVMASKNSLVNG
jgi:hypothetical protein